MSISPFQMKGWDTISLPYLFDAKDRWIFAGICLVALSKCSGSYFLVDKVVCTFLKLSILNEECFLQVPKGRKIWRNIVRLCIFSKNTITHWLKTPSQDILFACQASLLEQGAKGRPAMEANFCLSAFKEQNQHQACLRRQLPTHQSPTKPHST